MVVNCAGRTRSIIGAQSLINAGLPNKVVALRNGTMGYTLAGFAPDNGKDQRYAQPVPPRGLAWAQAAADRVGTEVRHHADQPRGAAELPRRRHPHGLCVRRARSDRTTRRAICPAPSTRPAASWCRRPTNMSARSIAASCWSTTARCAPS